MIHRRKIASVCFLLSCGLWGTNGHSSTSETPAHSIKSFGSLQKSADILLNKAGSLVFPTDVSSLPVEKKMDQAIAKYPRAAEYLGFDPGPEAPWRVSVRTFVGEIKASGVHTPFGRFVITKQLKHSADYNASAMKFLEDRLGTDPSLSTEDRFVVPPHRIVFIVGNYRSGTSIIHRLLAQDPRAIFMPQWALKVPILTKAGRREFFRPYLANGYSPFDTFQFLAPQIARDAYQEHPMAPELAEEDGLFWAASSFAVPGFFVHEFAVPRRKDVAGTESLRENSTLSAAYDPQSIIEEIFLQKTLPGYLGAWLHKDSPLWTQLRRPKEGDEAFLVLKAPFYGSRLDALRRAFPKATFISTNRETAGGTVSILKLWIQSLSMFVHEDRVKTSDVARNILDHYAGIAGGLGRAQMAGLIDINLRHKDIVKDPIAVIDEQIYPKLQIAPTHKARKKMKALVRKMEGSLKRRKKIDPKQFDIQFEEEFEKRPEFQLYRTQFQQYL